MHTCYATVLYEYIPRETVVCCLASLLFFLSICYIVGISRMWKKSLHFAPVRLKDYYCRCMTIATYLPVCIYRDDQLSKKVYVCIFAQCSCRIDGSTIALMHTMSRILFDEINNFLHLSDSVCFGIVGKVLGVQDPCIPYVCTYKEDINTYRTDCPS